MRFVTYALLVCSAACVEVAPDEETIAPSARGDVVDPGGANVEVEAGELGLELDPDLDPAGLVCRGKARCACFEVRADGTEQKIVNSDFDGTCDPNDNCRATCGSCAKGQARSQGDNCRVKSTTIADDAVAITAISPSESARTPTASCGCPLVLSGVTYPFTATFNAGTGGFHIGGPANLPGGSGQPFAHSLDPAIPFTCDEACSYGVSSWLGLTFGAADAP